MGRVPVLACLPYRLVKVLTSETPAKVVIEIKDGEGNILHTLEIPEE